jgi:hypothetical protein
MQSRLFPDSSWITGKPEVIDSDGRPLSVDVKWRLRKLTRQLQPAPSPSSRLLSL